MKFKPGDKVIHKPNGEDNATEEYLLKIGQAIHTITNVNYNGTPMLYTDLCQMGAFATRFELAQPYLNELKLKKVLGLE